MKKLKHIAIFSILLSLCFIQLTSAQFNIPEKPSKTEDQTSVYDYIDLLSASQKNNLEKKLIHYSDTTSTQIVVAIISSTKGENIGLLAPKWAHEWGVGQAKEDNGVFILLAKDDRKIWISPGYGVEHKLTAGVTGELIRNVIIPEFKRNDYYAGLDKGSDAVFKVLNGEYKGQRQNTSDDGFPIIIIFLLIFIFVIFMIAISKNKSGGNNDGSGNNKSGNIDILEAIILSNMGRGSYKRSSGGGLFGGGSSGGGSFGGGGFGGGFGGGGFSGGGAGGSW